MPPTWIFREQKSIGWTLPDHTTLAQNHRRAKSQRSGSHSQDQNGGPATEISTVAIPQDKPLA
jgi:hypothetical protein